MKMYHFSNNIFAFHSSYNIYYYQYVDGFLIDSNCKNALNESIYEICEIDKNKIAIYAWNKGKIYGYNDFLIFYDWVNDSKIDSIKIGDGEGSDKHIRKINDNIIILQHKVLFYLIDIKKRKIKQKISLYTRDLTNLIKINDKIILVKYSSNELCQYEVKDENKVVYSCSKSIESFDEFMKFPGNRLIFINNEKKICSIYA